jgi:starch synthase
VSQPLTVWHVTREYAGLAEAGGVKDVVRGLAEAHARAGAMVSVVLPLYGFLPRDLAAAKPVTSFALSLPDQDKGNAFQEETVRVLAAQREGVRLLLVDSPRFSQKRDVYVYTAEDEKENRWRTRGSGHWDFHQLNLTLQRAALETALALDELPDVFHCHDGHTGFLPALMREDARYAAPFRRTGAVLTIHNAGAGYHQEVWDPGFAGLLTGLPEPVLSKGELDGATDPLLLAGSYARLVTVSERYAEEMLGEREKEMSGGLGRTLRERGIPLRGITNGIDPSPWDPRFPQRTGLPAAFNPETGDLAGKRKCREVLAERLALKGHRGFSDEPVYAFVGRLTGQKGVHQLYEAIRKLVGASAACRFVVLGQGEKTMEAMLANLAAQTSASGRLTFVARYDNPLASLIYAGSDFFLIPSAYEPCGLTDYVAQLVGSIPVVHHVGGLVKVRDGETGFSYDEHSTGALVSAIERTAGLYRRDPQALERIRRRAFREIFSHHTWDRVLSDGYLPLYEKETAHSAWTGK